LDSCSCVAYDHRHTAVINSRFTVQMRISFSVFVASLTVMVATPAPVLAWGKTGHRVIAQIAEPYLSAEARAGVKGILGVETMAEASNWPDFMRSDPSDFWQHTASPWHYVTVPAGKTYTEAGAPEGGDAVSALQRFSATIRDPMASLADKQLALRFIIHIVGDLHQPLHAGNGSDKGGNDVNVTFQGHQTNLHSVWDSALVDEEQLSYSEMATWLGARITPQTARSWMVAKPEVWIAESTKLRDQIYPTNSDRILGYRYVYENTPRMELRLEQGGVRLAAYLNQLFAASGRKDSKG
jgi:hypothetical protein